VILSDEYFFDRLGHGSVHQNAISKFHKEKEVEVSLELGTGWYPVVPISMFLFGVKKIYTTDISCLIDKEKVITTIERFISAHQNGELAKYINAEEAKINKLKEVLSRSRELDFETILKEVNITYLNADARKLSFPDSAFDFIHSNNTLEHIYEEILIPILKEFKRVLKPGGVMSHFIDMSDHFAHADKSITIYNYLKYSPNEWKRIDNDVQPQNRMRIDQYKKVYSDLGIIINVEDSRPGNIDELKSVKLDAQFASMLLAEVAKSHTYLVSIN